MNKLSAFLLLCLLSAGIQANDQCIDGRAALVGPCEEGTQRFYDRGSCTRAYEFENTYCATEEMTNVEFVVDDITLFIENAPYFDIVYSELLGDVFTKPGQAKDCKRARMMVGQSKAAIDQAAQTGMEIGIGNELLSFQCLKK